MTLKTIADLHFDIVLVSGGRVGGSGGSLEIGGTVDSNLSVLVDPVSGDPYLPGSSIKGKLRSIVEKVSGKVDGKGGPCRCGSLDCPVCPLFGAHMNLKAPSAPTRITVRDAFLTEASLRQREQALIDNKDRLELKTEVIVGRISGTGDHPRTGERVPAGTSFHAHIVVHVFDVDVAPLSSRSASFKGTLENALGILAEAEALGASGSRGYGEVRIENATWAERPVGALKVAFKTAS
jgi:CRISPR-associated protein Csm3